MNNHLTDGQLDPTAYSPVTSAFASATPNELKVFFDAFMLNKPYCLDELIQVVWKTSGYERWSADFSPESLEPLGEWFAAQICERAQSSPAVETGFEEVASLAVATGMYYGEVAVRNNPSLGWHTLNGSKRQADYGQPVVSSAGNLPTNPVRVAQAFASGIADGSKAAGRLRETYDYWMQLIKGIP
ncbi:hypothetical protein ICY20_11670 [Pseudomonas sp. P115]|uniref:hypothetical protein n=1 Tax=Pseudomonas pisciculturae TaxID=2730413 RepID=UPI00135C7B98|nr:hypothetical protein [Pseudomonas pisciculturae]MBF6028401.1 hypothetical protein [Pseudomonas pisciculturae]